MGGPPTQSQKLEAARFPNIQLFFSPYKLEWMDSPWVDVAAAGEWLLDIERQFRPEVIHLNGYTHGVLPWSVPKVIVGHSCALSWWKAVNGCDAPPAWDAYRHKVKAGLRSADVVVAPSQSMLDSLREHYGPLGKSKVIPNGRALKAHRTPRKQNLILSAGRIWDEAKNISMLESVAPSLPWPVAIAGQVKQPRTENRAENPNEVLASLRGRAEEKSDDSQTNIWYLGQLESAELQSWFCRASIYALPARYEPFGLSPLEAASCGCALVLGDISSLREIWADAALFVSPDNKIELQSTLKRLIANEPLREELARKAFSRAAQFTPEQMARDYLLTYSEALQSDCREMQEAACVS
jgi:glycosyltransferase involved in cell wall biosynthesis